MEEKIKISHRGKSFAGNKGRITMKVLVVSDTMGEMSHWRWQSFGAALDYLIHCGDVEGRECFLIALAECPSVPLWQEIMIFSSDLPREDEILLEGHKIMVTHGTIMVCPWIFMGFRKRRQPEAVRLFCFGHTHKPVVEKKKWYCDQSGKPFFPRQEGRRPSYAVMELHKGEEPEIEIRYL